MTNPGTPPGGTQYIRLPYPEDSDKKIRRAAELVFYDAAIHALDMIKNELCGNAERAGQLADLWGRDTTMNDSKLDLNSMRNNLASYWRGPAYNAFLFYTGNVVGVMDKDLAVMGTVSTTLGAAVTTVFDTYASAITFIGNCVANLGTAGAWAIIGAATSWIPGVNILTTAAVVNKIIDALASFVRDVTALVSAATTQIGQYKAQGLAFANLATQFQHPEPTPGAITHVGEWQVNPNR